MKKKTQKMLSLFLCSILIITPLFVFLLFQYSPNQQVESTITYDPSLLLVDGATSTPLGTEGLEVGLYADGIFVQNLYCDFSSTISFSADLTKSYTLNVTQGITSTIFVVDLEGTNNFLIDGWRVNLDFYKNGVPLTDTIDMFMWDGSTWFDIGDFFIFDSDEQVCLPVGIFGIMNPSIANTYNFTVLQTDVDFLTAYLDVLDWNKTKKKKKRERKRCKLHRLPVQYANKVNEK